MTSSTFQVGAATAPEANSRQILLVEDHPDTREGLRRMLERCGYRVRGAGTCAEALVVAAEMSARRLDVIVGDVGLPDGDGVELMKTIMSRHACRAIALTGWGDAEDLKRYAAAGIDRAFVKPVEFGTLVQALEALVGET